MIEEDEKGGAEVCGASAQSDSPPPVRCGRGHRHASDAQVAECDYRLDMRERHKPDGGARGGAGRPER